MLTRKNTDIGKMEGGRARGGGGGGGGGKEGWGLLRIQIRTRVQPTDDCPPALAFASGHSTNNRVSREDRQRKEGRQLGMNKQDLREGISDCMQKQESTIPDFGS